MDNEQGLDNHSKTIIHIDVDCFYAQVEMLKNPDLNCLPMGVSQKRFVVTCNYIARSAGIKKMMLITEAKEKCPELVLINGEDLHDYRQYSYKITELLLHSFSLVERLGLDENYIDATDEVHKRLHNYKGDLDLVGNVFGDSSDLCDCGCTEQMKMGSIIAQELRDKIKTELKLTTCAGIAHNKLLAKIAGGRHKPNQQTIVFPNEAVELILSIQSLQKIPGLGQKLCKDLEAIGITSIDELQNCDFAHLSDLLGSEKARATYDLSFGIDRSPVKTTGKPQSIGIEDSKHITAEAEVIEKLHELLSRLLLLVAEDGRIPRTIRLTVRQTNKTSRVTVRESRQCNVNPSLFNCKDISQLSQNSVNKIMSIIMRLFSKLVDTKKPYHLSLLGLAFTKFLEKPNIRSTLTKFLYNNMEVQSITDIENKYDIGKNSPKESSPSTSYFENSDSSDIEQSSKKCRTENRIVRRRFHNEDCDSPCKLKVADLRLNSVEKSSDENQNVPCPPNADEGVFRELPNDLQLELWKDYKQSRERIGSEGFNRSKKTKKNTILDYLVK
ncbi:unnamed protein product [Acanthoscelides obtectus]|uniref:UmuC domain-containing protein n=1 Tax=Acanthoscelides obtectus TaxID=200917 RepID=A0A9P0NVN6_ACAOB|nr:unnamed protein product [Acanthoscelides obtectus]CAK1640264.1 DNA polymerase iota [Acanthoscelides obtectus]